MMGWLAFMAYRAVRKSRQLLVQLWVERIGRTGYDLQFDMHGLFNQLNSMGAGLFARDAAFNYDKLTEFSRHMREQLTYRHRVLWTVQEELDFITDRVEWYSQLNNLKVTTDFRTDTPATTLAQIPALLLYTFADNSLRHGIKNKGEAGNLEIMIKTEGRQIHARVLDNGVGQIIAMAANNNSRGKGRNLIKLYQLLFGKSNRGGLSITRQEACPGATCPGMQVEVRWNPYKVESCLKKVSL